MLLLAGFAVSGCSTPPEVDRYVVEDEGRSTIRSFFDKREPDSASQWAYARQTQDRGQLKTAERRMLYLHRRWPNSKEAPWAARARADMLFSREQWESAFFAYQYLIDNYSSRMQDYDSVLERQYAVAVKVMERKRMRWFFGGYRAPEYAIEYFETVIRNGPQWDRAPEAQFMIGTCHQEAKEYDLAVMSYGVLGYRYPDSAYAEEAAWLQLGCLEKLREEYPSDSEILERILTSSTVFISTFPESKYIDRVKQFRNKLYEIMAERAYKRADFYVKVPKEAEAAIICFEQMIEEFPKSRKVPEAKERIIELKALLKRPEEAGSLDVSRSRPLPFTKEYQDDED
ncbi:MAG TPA: tetratricopeptide repeat protein [Pontiella sp.]